MFNINYAKSFYTYATFLIYNKEYKKGKKYFIMYIKCPNYDKYMVYLLFKFYKLNNILL